MGTSISAMRNSEAELLNAGRDWYRRWKEHQQASDEAAPMPSQPEIYDVPLGDGLNIHTVRCAGAACSDEASPASSNEISGRGSSDETSGTATDGTLVCMHGFATGLGIYYSVLPQLAERWHGTVCAIDLLGCGLSSRPRWKLGHGQTCSVEEAEGFFVDGVERWRQAMRIDRMVLLGHSLGGYLAIAYAERYPERVDRLILASAVGTPAAPSELDGAHEQAPWPAKLVLGAWASGWSPMSVAKLGLADVMLGQYVKRRFSDASWVAKPELKEYFKGVWTSAPNSAGGYAHATLLRPGGIGELAYAREPTGPTRIPSLAVRKISAIYGDRDWMDW